MRYISNTPAQQKEMLGVIGVGSIEDLLVGRWPRPI
jgi:glycine cleavage system pyridoxal-binding protein P